MFMLRTLLNWQDNEHMYSLQDILQTHQVVVAVADKNLLGFFVKIRRFSYYFLIISS